MDRTLNVLLVEDEPLIALTLVDLLEELGHTAVEAGSGAAALTAFGRGEGIDILITDLGLPDIPGDELARLCREIRQDLPVLFATGHLSPGPGEEETADPPTVRMTKPFQLIDLQRALQRLCVDLPAP